MGSRARRRVGPAGATAAAGREVDAAPGRTGGGRFHNGEVTTSASELNLPTPAKVQSWTLNGRLAYMSCAGWRAFLPHLLPVERVPEGARRPATAGGAHARHALLLLLPADHADGPTAALLAGRVLEAREQEGGLLATKQAATQVMSLHASVQQSPIIPGVRLFARSYYIGSRKYRNFVARRQGSNFYVYFLVFYFPLPLISYVHSPRSTYLDSVADTDSVLS